MYEQYTDKQIVEMLVPKLNKSTKWCDWSGIIKYPERNENLIKAIATIYRSAYIRGQLGRSFIIGEKANSNEHWVPVNSNNVKKGDSVRYINELGHEKTPEYFPTKNVVGKVIKVCSNDNCYVQCPDGSTSNDDRWYAAWSNLEVLLCE